MSSYKKKRLTITLWASLFILVIVLFLGYIGNIALDIQNNIDVVDKVSEEVVYIESLEVENSTNHYPEEISESLTVITDTSTLARDSLREKSESIVNAIKYLMITLIVFSTYLIYQIRKITEERCTCG